MAALIKKRRKLGRNYIRLSEEKIKEIRKLAQGGLSLEKIASKLNLGKSTVYYHARPYCRKQTRLNLNALTMKEKGYIIGMFVGDGNILWRRGKGQYGIKITLDNDRDQDIAYYLHLLFTKAGKKSTIRTEGNSLSFRVFSKKLVGFLSKHVKIVKQASSQRNIKTIIGCKSWGSEFKLGFISGLLDSDGYMFHSKKGKHYGAMIKTSSFALKEQIQEIFSELQISVKIRVHEFKGTYQTRNLCYDIYIQSSEMRKFCPNLVSVKHSKYH